MIQRYKHFSKQDINLSHILLLSDDFCQNKLQSKIERALLPTQTHTNTTQSVPEIIVLDFLF